jgi:predicted nucleic acid-binding protein
MRFVDTNILLYAVSTAADERVKKERALEILDAEDVALSVQVLQEFYVQATHRRRAARLTHDQALSLVESWLRFRVQDLTTSLLQGALATTARWNISYWDAAIVEAARAAGCPTLLSEDLQDGMDFAGVRVENPFRDAA